MITNPILCGFNPDPSLCTDGNCFYIATSTFEYFPGVRIYRSYDLKHWEFAISPLDTVDKLNMLGNESSGGIWAPNLSFSNGTFYLLYTDVKVISAPWKNARNYLIKANSIEGPWSAPIPMDNGGFDPFLLHDDDKKYFVYRTFGPGHHSDPHNRIYLMEYDDHQEKIVKGKRTCIYKGTEFKYTEGPQLLKKDGFYYLICAEGGTSFEHRVTVCRSPNLLGPYEESPFNPLITSFDDPLNPIQKAGHASLTETKCHEWYMAYLMSRPIRTGRPLLARGGRGFCPLGRETSIAKIIWQDGWPRLDTLGHNPSSQVAEPKGLADHPFLEDINGSFKEDFSGKTLSHHFQTLRIPFDKVGSLSVRKKHLRLFGLDSLVSTFEQGSVGTRWRHRNFSVTVKMEFSPKHFQQSAGVACYYNDNHFTYLALTRHMDSRKKILAIYEVDAGVFSSRHLESDFIELEESVKELCFKINVNKCRYSYAYSLDGENYIDFKDTFSSQKISDDYIQGRGFFTGAFVMLHCEDISSDGCYADFSEFEYKVLE